MSNRNTTKAGEYIIFWIGSICGIVLSFWTIYEKIIAPSPAFPIITFLHSDSDVLPIATNNKKNDSIPLKLKIINKGEKIASNTVVYLTCYSTIQIVIEDSIYGDMYLGSNNEEKNRFTINIGNVNPGESRILNLLVNVPFLSFDTCNVILHPIEYDISSETTNSLRGNLSIVLGQFDTLKERYDTVFWIGNNDNVHSKSIILAKDDYN